jgi:hypothetical protein
VRKPPADELRDDRLYGVAAVGRFTDQSDSTVYRLIQQGEYTAVRDGARLKVPGRSIRRRVESLPRTPIKVTP